MGSMNQSRNVLPSKDNSSESNNSIEEGEIVAEDDDVVVFPKKGNNKRQSDNSTEEGQIVAEDNDVVVVPRKGNNERQSDNSTEEGQIAAEDGDVVVVPRKGNNERQSDNSTEEGQIAAEDGDVVVVPRKGNNERQSDNSTEGQIAAEDGDVVVVPRIPRKGNNKRQSDNSTEEGQIAAEDGDVVVVARKENNKRQRTGSDDEPKKIFVKMTKTIVCIVKNTDRIDDIKMLVENMEGIASTNQTFFFRQIRLKGTKTVGDYNIPTNSCIEMYVKDGIRISIEDNINSLSLDVKISNTVSQVKAMMRVEGGIPSDEDIALFFAYKKLHEDQTLGSCGVHHNAVLQMVTRRSRSLLVTVKLLNGAPIELVVQSWYSIAELKHILGLPKLLLSYGDKKLEDKKSLHSYDINDHAVLKERLT